MDRLGELPEREQAALRMHVMEGQTLSEVGDSLGLSRTRSRQLVMAGLKKLREEADRDDIHGKIWERSHLQPMRDEAAKHVSRAHWLMEQMLDIAFSSPDGERLRYDDDAERLQTLWRELRSTATARLHRPTWVRVDRKLPGETVFLRGYVYSSELLAAMSGSFSAGSLVPADPQGRGRPWWGLLEAILQGFMQRKLEDDEWHERYKREREQEKLRREQEELDRFKKLRHQARHDRENLVAKAMADFKVSPCGADDKASFNAAVAGALATAVVHRSMAVGVRAIFRDGDDRTWIEGIVGHMYRHLDRHGDMKVRYRGFERATSWDREKTYHTTLSALCQTLQHRLDMFGHMRGAAL